MAEVRRIPEQYAQPKPEFDGGVFTISAFSLANHGFDVQTREVLGRTAGISSNHLDAERTTRLQAAQDAVWIAKLTGAPAEDIAALETNRGDERRRLGPNATRLRDGMRGELSFNGVKAVTDARAEWLASTGSADDAAELERTFADERETYHRKGKKIGIRNITVDGNTVIVDVKYVAFPVYNQFARLEDGPEMIDLSANAATAMIVRSKDGRLIIQHRAVAKQRLTEPTLSRGNAQFTDIPGASVAGMLDAQPQKPGPDRQPGKPEPIDTSTVKGGILKEAGEELGLEADDLGEVRIVGVAHDKIKVHDEFLLLANSHLTAEQIRERSRTSKRNKGLGDADFEEKFIDIDGSADSIATLLTQVRCPLPPTHAAALVAAGYSLVLQEQGKEAADVWKAEIEIGVQRNYRGIDRTVKEFYDRHPEVLTQVPERFWGKRPPARKLQGYDPAYTPEEQGLPSFEEAMVESGLMPETRQLVPEADLFDIDGVITDPETKEVIHPEILDKIADRLKSGIPIALNTGRSLSWLMEPVLEPLLERFKDDKAGLENLAIIAEFGGTWAVFNEDGNMQEGRVSSLTVPEELYEEVKEVVAGTYGELMFDDATKETMISVEMRRGGDLAEFHAQQRLLAEQLQELLYAHELTDTYEVHTDTIATNIRSPRVGKDLGAERFLQFLRDKGIKPARFRTYGDSAGDLAMADELHRRGQQVDFIYVGDQERIEDVDRDFPVIFVPGYSGGTKDYLNNS